MKDSKFAGFSVEFIACVQDKNYCLLTHVCNSFFINSKERKRTKVDFSQGDANGSFVKSDQKEIGASDQETPKVSNGIANGNSRKIVVQNLTWETELKHLKEYFEKFGEMESVNLRWSPQTGKSQCFAVIVFKETSSTKKVLNSGDHAINNKRVDVSEIYL